MLELAVDKSIKLQVKELLIQRDYDKIVRLYEEDKRSWRALQSYLYESDENLRWPAIEAVGVLLKAWWYEVSQEKVKEYIRGLIWLLNDESGGIGWSAPETIAETIANIPELLEPWGNVLVSNAYENPLLIKGSLWATGRLGKQASEEITLVQDQILKAFDSDDAETPGLAAWASGEAGFTPALVSLEGLEDREEAVKIFIGGRFQEKSLGEWAKNAIAKIR